MDLLDDFDRVRATFSELGAIGQRIDSTVAEEGGPSSLNVASTSYDLPGLSVEATVRQAARCSLFTQLSFLPLLMVGVVLTLVALSDRGYWLFLPY